MLRWRFDRGAGSLRNGSSPRVSGTVHSLDRPQIPQSGGPFRLSFGSFEFYLHINNLFHRRLCASRGLVAHNGEGLCLHTMASPRHARVGLGRDLFRSWRLRGSHSQTWLGGSVL